MKNKISDRHLRVLEKESIGCRDVERLLGDHTDHELSCSLRARIDAHIGNCSKCRELRDSYNWVIELAHGLADAPAPREVHNRLREALNARLGLSLPLAK